MAHLFEMTNSSWIRFSRPAAAALMLLFATALSAFGAQEEEKKPAKVKIAGYGLFGNRELLRTLRTLELSGKRPEVLNASFIEDASMMLVSRIRRDGYLNPIIRIRLTLLEGGQMETSAAEIFETPLPRPLRVTRAEFRIQEGVRFFYENVEFEGLELLTPKQGQEYFIETGTLLRLRQNRIYTPERLKRSLSNLSEFFENRGYQDVRVEVQDLDRNDSTGATSVRVLVNKGQQYIADSVEERYFYSSNSSPAKTRLVYPHKPYSRIWQQDYNQTLRTNQFALGYPDTEVETRILDQRDENGTIEMELQTDVKSGEEVRVGSIDFFGERHTSRSFMERRIPIESGDLLNPIQAEEGRYRLAQLGIFDSVELKYEQVDETTRNIIYEVHEAKRFNVSLLFGYGSYELLRGGVEAQMNNIFGTAQRANVKAVQSFKASSGDFTYTVPQVFTTENDLFIDGSALRREEVSFTREEYGGGAGVHRYFRDAHTDFTVQYAYEILNADETEGDFAVEGRTNAAVSSIITDLKHDRRDNPLYPRKGYKAFARVELASDALGGEVTYQRIDNRLSWHRPLGRGTFVSVGLDHGLVHSAGDALENLPFNRRYFPGGENSLRGYQEGEASPRNAEGLFVGAETITLGSVEFEQALTPRWSFVIFSDSLGYARRLEDYPFDTGLFSAGVGLRWRTIVGPVRLEYGHNLNPREDDPSGTLHFSLGFPF